MERNDLKFVLAPPPPQLRRYSRAPDLEQSIRYLTTAPCAVNKKLQSVNVVLCKCLYGCVNHNPWPVPITSANDTDEKTILCIYPIYLFDKPS